MSKRAKPSKIAASIIMLVSVVLVFCFLNVCKKEKAFSSPRGQVWEIMGRPDKLEDSGAVSVEYEIPECVIHYNFQPRGKSKYEDELGSELTPRLKKLMESDKNIEKLSITIFGSSTDTYGRYGWNPVLFFEFDRETFDSIDWRNFDRKDLLEIVKNLTWYQKSMQGKRDSA